MPVGKKLAILATLILAALLAFGLFTEERKSEQERQAGEALYASTQHLRVQRRDLQNELEKLEEQLAREKQGMGSIVILFTELREEVYTEAFPILEEYGYTATLGLSDSQFPGQVGCMDKVQYQQLLDAGWSVCLQWDGQRELETYLAAMKELGAPSCEALYVESGYAEDMDAQLLKLGFKQVVHHGETSLPLIITEDEPDLWHPGAMPWNRSGIKTMITNATNQGGNLVVTLNFAQGPSHFDAKKLPLMCDYVKGYSETLFVTNLLDARDYRRGRAVAGVDPELDAQIAELQAKIARLDEEMEELKVNAEN